MITLEVGELYGMESGENMSREEAYKTIKENLCAMCAYGSQCMESCDISSCDNRDAIKALEQEPKIVPIAEIKFDEDKLKELVNKAFLTVTQQEPFKPMAEIDLNSVIKQDIINRYKAESEKKRASVLERARVLDKIRTEINDIAFDWQEIDGEHESLMVVELNDALNIIDKYKAKTE